MHSTSQFESHMSVPDLPSRQNSHRQSRHARIQEPDGLHNLQMLKSRRREYKGDVYHVGPRDINLQTPWTPKVDIAHQQSGTIRVDGMEVQSMLRHPDVPPAKSLTHGKMMEYESTSEFLNNISLKPPAEVLVCLPEDALRYDDSDALEGSGSKPALEDVGLGQDTSMTIDDTCKSVLHRECEHCLQTCGVSHQRCSCHVETIQRKELEDDSGVFDKIRHAFVTVAPNLQSLGPQRGLTHNAHWLNLLGMHKKDKQCSKSVEDHCLIEQPIPLTHIVQFTHCTLCQNSAYNSQQAGTACSCTSRVALIQPSVVLDRVSVYLSLFLNNTRYFPLWSQWRYIWTPTVCKWLLGVGESGMELNNIIESIDAGLTRTDQEMDDLVAEVEEQIENEIEFLKKEEDEDEEQYPQTDVEDNSSLDNVSNMIYVQNNNSNTHTNNSQEFLVGLADDTLSIGSVASPTNEYIGRSLDVTGGESSPIPSITCENARTCDHVCVRCHCIRVNSAAMNRWVLKRKAQLELGVFHAAIAARCDGNEIDGVTLHRLLPLYKRDSVPEDLDVCSCVNYECMNCLQDVSAERQAEYMKQSTDSNSVDQPLPMYPAHEHDQYAVQTQAADEQWDHPEREWMWLLKSYIYSICSDNLEDFVEWSQSLQSICIEDAGRRVQVLQRGLPQWITSSVAFDENSLESLVKHTIVKVWKTDTKLVGQYPAMVPTTMSHTVVDMGLEVVNQQSVPIFTPVHTSQTVQPFQNTPTSQTYIDEPILPFQTSGTFSLSFPSAVEPTLLRRPGGLLARHLWVSKAHIALIALNVQVELPSIAQAWTLLDTLYTAESLDAAVVHPCAVAALGLAVKFQEGLNAKLDSTLHRLYQTAQTTFSITQADITAYEMKLLIVQDMNLLEPLHKILPNQLKIYYSVRGHFPSIAELQEYTWAINGTVKLRK